MEIQCTAKLFQGPNYTWHIDGNNKLRQFGFCIHSGIDGLVYLITLRIVYALLHNKDIYQPKNIGWPLPIYVYTVGFPEGFYDYKLVKLTKILQQLLLEVCVAKFICNNGFVKISYNNEADLRPFKEARHQKRRCNAKELCDTIIPKPHGLRSVSLLRFYQNLYNNHIFGWP